MKRKAWFLLAAFAVLAESGWSQRVFNWRVYKAADGLPESACSSVSFSPRGRVWVTFFTAESVSYLDGYTVQNLPAPGSGGGRLYESPGGQLWTTAEGGLREFRDGAWVSYAVPEIAAQRRAAGQATVHRLPLCPARQGRVLFVLPNGLMELNAEDPAQPQIAALRPAGQTKLERFLGMSVARDGGLWIAGRRGLARIPGPARAIKPDTEWQEYVPPAALQIEDLQEPQEDVDGVVSALATITTTNRQKVAVRFDGQHWTVQPFNNQDTRFTWTGPGRQQFAATLDLMYVFDSVRSQWIANEEVSTRQYFDLAVEPGGAFWLATSDGLFRCAPCLWQTPGFLTGTNSLVRCITEDAAGGLWLASAGALYALQDEQLVNHAFPAQLAERLQSVRALYAISTNALVLDAGSELFQFQPSSGQFRPLTSGESKLKPLGWLPGGGLCVQALNSGGADTNGHLESYDGTSFKPFTTPQPAPSLGPELLALFVAQNGTVWLSSGRGTACYHDDKWQTFAATDGTVPLGAVGFVELPDGRIWCATPEKVWEFTDHNWKVVRAGFDHINALVHTRDGSVWVASNIGIHRFWKNAWVRNDLEDGLPSPAVRQVLEDHRGRVWACTTRGLSAYHPEADPDPPETSIQILAGHETNSVPEGTTVTLAFGGVDKWKYTASERLLYSYRLDDMDWSPFQEPNNASFSDLPAGKHYFQVRAMDRNCNVDPAKPARLEFAVARPWYKEARSLRIAIAGAAVAVFFAGLAFNRHRQLLRSYAEVERKVAERTQQLEIASRELVHSQKMNALGTLAAGIAHDFNNILSIIKGSAQIIEDNLENPQKIQTRVERIKTVVEQGSGIVKAMLGFSRSSDEQAGPCDLNAVVGETIKLLGDRFLREVEVKFEPAADLPKVPGSQDFIQQILLNFIFNAAEAMTDRREVTLATGKTAQLPAGVVLAPAPAAEFGCISVRDLGCGIAPANLPRIFEPFFTTKAMSAKRGTGLGLSMVYELAKKMGAGLAVESVVNQGSTFVLILPVRDLPAAPKT